MKPADEIPTRAEVLSRATGITERIAARTSHSERARRLDPDSLAAMTEAGIWRLLAPRRYGGYEMSLATEVESTPCYG
jgi:alkylation response protein AidB-like acyl-CoA dehydrogenase